MTREAMLWLILNSIFLVVFNVFFFLFGGTDRNASVWISYGFIHFAYFMLILTPKLTQGKKSWTELGFPLYLISAVYFLVAYVIGAIFILIAPEGFTIAFAVQLCIAGMYGTALVSNMIANERTAEAEQVRKTQISYIKEASVKVKSLLDSVSDKEAKKKVERVYDALYSSPVKSHPDLEMEESRLLRSIRALEEAVSAGHKDSIIDIAGSLETAIGERNRRLAACN